MVLNQSRESLFEAEMHRCRDHIRSIEKLNQKHFSFVIMDEIFTGTNPKEGISGGYAICKKLASFKNSISIITTHFDYLTKIDKGYRNYHMPIERIKTRQIKGSKEKKSDFKYTYKLKEGPSNQFIALELLDKKGFDKKIVKWANRAYLDIQV